MRDKKPLRHLHGCSLNRQKLKFKIHDSLKHTHRTWGKQYYRLLKFNYTHRLTRRGYLKVSVSL